MSNENDASTAGKNQNQTDENEPAENEAHIHKIGIKVPPFWHDCPEIWFAQIEAQFSVGKITSDNAKYNTIVASIESKILCQVSEAVLNPPNTDKYKHLKDLIISRYSDSAQSKIQKLLSEMSLGDQKPSQLLTEMKRLGGTAVTDEFMKTLWLSNLPQQTKAILSTNDVELSQLAKLADKIMEVSQGSVQSVERSTNSERTGSSSSSLELRIESLTRAVEKLTETSLRGRKSSSSPSSENHSRSRSAHRSTSTKRSNTPAKMQHKYEFCWYHHRFGNAATKCVDPCKFSISKN